MTLTPAQRPIEAAERGASTRNADIRQSVLMKVPGERALYPRHEQQSHRDSGEQDAGEHRRESRWIYADVSSSQGAQRAVRRGGERPERREAKYGDRRRDDRADDRRPTRNPERHEEESKHRRPERGDDERIGATECPHRRFTIRRDCAQRGVTQPRPPPALYGCGARGAETEVADSDRRNLEPSSVDGTRFRPGRRRRTLEQDGRNSQEQQGEPLEEAAQAGVPGGSWQITPSSR